MKNVTFEETVDTLPDGEVVRGKLIRYTDKDGCAQVDEFVGATSDEWLQICDYGPTRLLTLLDIETKLRAANKASPKMTAVRQWLDGLLTAFVQNPEAKQEWPMAPYTFEETTQEAFAALTQP
jgi:hypothetical protein